MAYRMSKLAILRATDRTKFKKRLRRSIDRHDGLLEGMSKDLDVGHTTLKRWLNEFGDLKRHIDRVRILRT